MASYLSSIRRYLYRNWSMACLCLGLVFCVAAFAPDVAARYQRSIRARKLVRAPEGTAKGAARCDETTFNFGEVFVGEVVQHEFVLANSGAGSLAVAEVAKECKCTTLKSIDGKTIKPGELLALPVSLATGEKPGPIHRLVTVRFTDGSDLRLALEGIVKPRVSWSPQQLLIHASPVGPNQEKGITLKAAPELQGIAIKRASSSGSNLTVRLEERSSAHSWDVFVRVEENLPVGRFEDMVAIYTTDSVSDVILVPVTVVVTDRVADKP